MTPRRLAIGTAVSLLGAFALFLLVMARTGWGASQIGALSSWIAAGTTVAAVVVALRGSLKAEQAAAAAISTADNRAEEERKYGHRRESTRAVAELWAALAAVDDPLARFIATRPGQQSLQNMRDTGVVREEDARTRVLSAVSIVESRLFYANAIASEPHLHSELTELADLIHKLRTKVEGSHREQREELRTDLTAILGRQDRLLDIVRTHLHLHKSTEE